MNIGLNGLDGLSSYAGAFSSGSVSGDNLTGKLGNVDKSTSAEELKEACRAFESFFMEEVYKEMLNTIGSDEDGDPSMTTLVDYFKDGAIQTISAQTTKQSGGVLAQQLYEQMKRNYGIEEA